MSKINELRRKATEAARKRDWPKAIKLYERVCEIDSNNASFRNELGDIHLKTGDVVDALESFTKAAELYRAVGLHNNAVAVLKKILRHDKDHLDALWDLGELKEVQGLDSDAQLHYIDFLSKSEIVNGSSRDKFVNRCHLLLEKLGDDLQMLSRIEMIFEAWGLAEDHARVIVQKARMALEEGQSDLVEKYVSHAREVYADLDTLDDYIELRRTQAGTGDAPSAAVDTSDAGISCTTPAAESNEPGIQDVDPERPATQLSGGESMRTGEIDLGFDIEVGGSASPTNPEPNTIQIDVPATDPEPSAQATEPEPPAQAAEPEPATPAPEEAAAPNPEPPVAEPPAADDPAAKTPSSGTVNLLDELLSDSDGFDLKAGENEQMDAIRSNLGNQLASQLADDDHAGHYELGLVYMDMGLYDQASDAFAKSAKGSEHRLKGLEMQGSCLRQMGRKDSALAVFLEGLSDMAEPDVQHLGLLYEAGVCFEEMGQAEDARRAYEQVVAVDGAFRDVAQRLDHLGATTG